MYLSRLLLVGLLALPLPALAETTSQPPAAEISVTTLSEVMQLPALFAVLRQEGLDYGATLEKDMFPGGGGPGWKAAVDALYDDKALLADFNAVLEAELARDPATLAEIIAFYQGKTGLRIASLEVEARRAFLDEASEEAARVAAEDRAAARDPKVKLLERFITAGDMVEMNVAGALSGNLAFMQGMSNAGAYGQPMPEADLMGEVWAQEQQIRNDTTSWLHAYLGLAYEPLSEREMQDYVDFMESPAGQRLNAALFLAFDQVFRQLSYDLGLAAGTAMLGQDI